MFELEKEITGWKQAVDGDGVVTPEETSELESHLRESVASLGEKGLTEQEAFMVATNRLGYPLALQEEYSKNNLTARWKQRVFWMLTGYLGLRVISDMVSVIGSTTAVAMAYGGFGGAASSVAMISLMAVAWSFVFFIAFRGRQQFGSKSDSLSLKWVVAIGALLIFAPAFNMAIRVAWARFVPAAWYGEAAIYLSVGGFTLNFCIVTLCFIALCKLNDRSAWNLG